MLERILTRIPVPLGVGAGPPCARSPDRARRRRRRATTSTEVAGFGALVERFTGLTAAGAVVLLGSLLGFVLAKLARRPGAVPAGLRRPAAGGRRRGDLPAQAPAHRRAVGAADPHARRAGRRGRAHRPGPRPAARLRRAGAPVAAARATPCACRCPTVGGDDDFVHTYAIRPTLRGVYQLGPLAAEWTDPFGLARHQQVLTEPVDVIVHPTTDAIFDRPLTRMWEDPPFRPPVSKPWPQGFEFYGMRDYVPGDDPRRIVWTAAARTGKFLVRESEQGITDRITLRARQRAQGAQPRLPVGDLRAGRPRRRLARRVQHQAGLLGPAASATTPVLAPELRGGKARIALLDELARLELTDEPVHHGASSGSSPSAAATPTCAWSRPASTAGPPSRVRMLTEKGMSLVVALVQWEDSDPNAARRAREIGAQVVQVSPGQQLEARLRPRTRAGPAMTSLLDPPADVDDARGARTSTASTPIRPTSPRPPTRSADEVSPASPRPRRGVRRPVRGRRRLDDRRHLPRLRGAARRLPRRAARLRASSTSAPGCAAPVLQYLVLPGGAAARRRR